MNTNKFTSSTGRSLRAIATCVIIAGATLVLGVVDASAGNRGGGGNRGGSGNGGKMAQNSVSGANRSAAASRNDNDRNNNRNNNNNNNRNVNVNNSGNVRVGGNNNVNIDIDNDRHGCCYHGNNYHPILTGVAIGAVAVTTSAIVGSYYRTLPPSCTTVIRNGITYSYCGSVYYQQTWSGDDVVYVVVNP